ATRSRRVPPGAANGSGGWRCRGSNAFGDCARRRRGGDFKLEKVDTSVMDHGTLEQIEVKIAFLERANNELSDVVFRQQREIEALRAQIAALLDRVEAAQSRSDVLT